MSVRQVIIIGAGTGGLCLAHGLRRAGIQVAVFERERTRRDGLHGYDSRKQMDARHLIHKPVVGRIQLAAMRAGMRTINAISPLKRRVMESRMRLRKVQN